MSHRQEAQIKMDALEMLHLLVEAGYEHAPYMRSFGGPYCVKAPDGRFVYEEDFTAEIERITKPAADGPN